MRTFGIAIAAIVLGCCLVSTALAQQEEEQKKCEPGSQFMDAEQCNSCFCGPDGQTVSCTKKKCERITLTKRETPQICEPGSRFKDDCNWCTCSADGMLASCTRKMCIKRDKSIVPPPRREKRETRKCTPGEYFEAEDGCNTCSCNADGTPGGCTEMDCFVNVDPALFRQVRQVSEEQRCEPGSRFRDADGCNWCTCSADGKLAACTRRLCVAKPNRDRKTREAGNYCTPGSSFKNDCNVCRCSSDGKNAACTLRFCVPQDGGRVRRAVPVEEEAEKQICVPNSTFRDAEDCNNCFCNEKGTAAACTLKYCFKLNRDRRAAKVCVPNTTFKKECNTCRCNADGTAADCTEIGCHESLPKIAHSRSVREVKQVCEPSSHFKQDCNDCHCNAEGTAAACTLRGCLPKNFNLENLGHRETRQVKQVCEPNSSFKDDCNDCHCNAEGTEAACTERGCLKKDSENTVAIPQPEMECEPNSTFMQDCNTCFCSADGLVAGCTLIGCPEKICKPNEIVRAQDGCNTCRCNAEGTAQECTEVSCPVLAGPAPGVCIPNSVFKQDCNTCKCSSDGERSYCTRRLCRSTRNTNENEDKDKEVAAQPTPCTPDEVKIEVQPIT